MCHPGFARQVAKQAERREVSVSLPSGGQLPASWRVPGSGRGPAVLLISDIYGRTPFYEHLAGRLTEVGYVTLLPDLFFRQGELGEVTREAAFARHARLDENGALGDLEAALAWLRGRVDVVTPTVGLLGFCLGGTLALDLAASDRDLAVACYYAFPYGMTSSQPAPRPIDLTDRFHAPVVAFWGDRDYIDVGQIEEFSQAMRTAGNDYHYIVYPGQGHGFLAGLAEQGPATSAAEDSWARTLDFLATRLAPQGDEDASTTSR